MKQTKSFTVIEILIVVSIVTILATLGFSTYSSVQKKARDARRTSDLEIIRAGIEQYRSNNNDYPTALPYPAVAGNEGLCDPTGCTDGVYLGKIPTDPVGTQRYVYQRNNSSDYTLCARVTTGTSSFGDCSSGGTGLVCNYCMGPYGQK